MSDIMAGIASVLVGTDGVSLGDSLSWSGSGFTSEEVSGLTGFVGTVRKRAAHFVEFEIVVTKDDDLDALGDPDAERDITVNFVNGKTFVLYGGKYVGDPIAVNESGKVTLRYVSGSSKVF